MEQNVGGEQSDLPGAPTAASDAALEVEAVTKRYGEHTAVSKFSFTVPRGAIYGVLGTNGAGKTTTLRMINDILLPDEGSIRILGKYLPGAKAAPHIGYLPEERGLYPKMRVIDTLQFFGQLRGLSGREALARGNQWLERLDLADRKTAKVQDFSKGMQQKVQFAAALIHEPELIILDEPWSGLDPLNTQLLLDMVAEQKRAGKTILFSTHLLDHAEELCDYVCVINRGEKILDGSLDAVKRNAANADVVTVTLAGDDSESLAKEQIFGSGDLVSGANRIRANTWNVTLAEGAVADSLFRRLGETEVRVRGFHVNEPSLREIFVSSVQEHSAALDAIGGHDA